FVAAAGGLLWGLRIRTQRPSIYAGIGLGGAGVPRRAANARHVPTGDNAQIVPVSRDASPADAPVGSATTSPSGWSLARTGQAPARRRRAPLAGRAAAALSWIRALNTVRRLRPLWREIDLAVPGVALLPRYHGVAAIRSLLRSSRLAAVRMP